MHCLTSNVSYLCPLQMAFEIALDHPIQFNKCWNLLLRGHNKVGSFSIKTKQIKPCDDKSKVKAAAVVDCKGSSKQIDGMNRFKHQIDDSFRWFVP